VNEEFQMPDKYKLVFQNRMGREVLQDIVLRICRYGSTIEPDSQEQAAQYNVGVEIMAMTGLHPQALILPNVIAKPVIVDLSDKQSLIIKWPIIRKMLIKLRVATLTK